MDRKRGIDGRDVNCAMAAVELLRSEGFAVDAVRDIEDDGDGAAFTLDVHDANKSSWMGEDNPDRHQFDGGDDGGE